jgi:hypothetical protein
MQVMVIFIRWQSDDLPPQTLLQDVRAITIASANYEGLTFILCPIIPVMFFFPVGTSYRYSHKMAEQWHAVVCTNVVTRWQSNGKVLSHSPSCRISKLAAHRHTGYRVSCQHLEVVVVS